MSSSHLYDAAIIGGGLAGLALSIQLARSGHRVVLLEKENYPYHKVCGEYISLESWDFLEGLGLPLHQMQLPLINRVQVSAPGGQLLEQVLPLGGFGISRYTLDAALAGLARAAGVDLREGVKVNDVQQEGDCFRLQLAADTLVAKVVAGCFGKRSNLDVKWKRSFTLQKPNKLNHYIGVKYHLRAHWPDNLIGLHNFKDGYCGISRIEEGKYCCCYLTTAANLQSCNNSVEQMEQEVLSRNPHLQKIFSSSEKLYDSPLTISQISFDKKQQVENHILMVGDTSGMIAPLCGAWPCMAAKSQQGSSMIFCTTK
jgi:menaquinone-9 beta-reductase